MENYKDKVAVVTGGANGIGFGIASALAKKGCNIVITDIDAVSGETAEQKLKSTGAKALFIKHDVCKESDWDTVVETVKKEFGEVHYLFNNAGIMLRPAPLAQLTIKDWEWIMNVNFWGALHGLRKFTVLMESQTEKGLIITTASTAAVAPFSNWSPYSVSKAAVVRIVESYQAEANIQKKDKVKYAVAMPAVVDTDIINAETHRPKEYANSDTPVQAVPSSKAGSPQGDMMGKISVELAVERILKQIDYGYTYIYTHRDLTAGLIIEQSNAVLLNKPVVDQTIADFGYYAQKIKRKQ